MYRYDASFNASYSEITRSVAYNFSGALFFIHLQVLLLHVVEVEQALYIVALVLRVSIVSIFFIYYRTLVRTLCLAQLIQHSRGVCESVG